MGSKGGGGSYPVYHDDPDARRRQEEAHAREMDRLEKSHQQQMQIMQKTLQETTKVLEKTISAGKLAEQRYEKEKATLQDTQDIHLKLEQKRDDFKPIASKLEAGLHEAAKSGFDMILAEVENIKTASGLSIETSAIKRKIDNFIQRIDGSIGDVLKHRIALSDPGCAEILQIQSQDERESRLEEFLKKAIEESIQNSQNLMEEVMLDALDMVKDMVTNKINDKKQELQRAAVELTSLEKALTESEIREKANRYKSQIDGITDFINDAQRITIAAV